jgi:hypothetical protein
LKIKQSIILLAIILNGIALHRTWVYAQTFSFLEILGNNPFKPQLGIQQSLPPEAIDSKFLVDKYALKEVALGQEFVKNGYFSQRTLEFIYPIRVSAAGSQHLIELVAAKVKDCQAIESHHTVTLYDCQ